MHTKTNTRFVFRLNAVLKLLMSIIFCIGALAVIGWKFDLLLLKQVFPSLPVIAPNTAILFMFTSLSLFFVSLKKLTTPQQISVILFSLIITLTGFLTSIEYLLNLELGIDNLLFAEKMKETIVRMSPQSALNFIIVGLSLLLIMRKSKRSILSGQAIMLITGIVSLISLFGFIYNVTNLYTIYPYKGMAVHTAAAFAMTFTVIFAIHPEIGLMRMFSGGGLSGSLARRLFAALFFLIAVETLVMFGRQTGIYGYAYESLIHLLFIAGVFVFLIFYVFKSLDKLAEAEKNVAHIKAIDKAKTEFVSLASHQLRTPLTSISWYTEMLVKGDAGKLNEKQKKCLDEIYAGNQRMVHLVNDLLNTSRIDMGSLVLAPKPTDLVEIVESILEEIGSLIRNKKMKISENYEEKLPQITIDPEMIRIVFQNLISNSLKYTPHGGSISIEIKRQNSHIQVTISDNGYGIPKNQKNKIFTKMFRADNIISKGTSGTGLGLYITRAIVKESGGKIWFESEESKGSVFHFTLPINPKKIKVRKN